MKGGCKARINQGKNQAIWSRGVGKVRGSVVELMQGRDKAEVGQIVYSIFHDLF